MKALLLAFLLAAGLGYRYWIDHREVQVEMPPPATVPAVSENREPIQRDLAREFGFRMKEYKLTALAEFSIGARVILAKHYSSGRESDLAPVDLALGWGPMADPAVLNALTFSQANRFYSWHYEGVPPIPRRDIEINSANMHLIPSSREIVRRLDLVKAGDTVRIRGYLVQADGQDGWRWRSSLTREDTGAGACEVIFVQDLQVL